MSEALADERDYVLGTDEREIARLGAQHNAWLPVVLECWSRAGIAPGSRVIDLGAGPGHASVDLARWVGPQGHVTAVERSSRFVQSGRERVKRLGLANVTFHELDLMAGSLPPGPYDAAWCRWVCSFVRDPERLIASLAERVVSGGVAVFQEYVDYASWRFSPPLPRTEKYIREVMDSWREAGGEPDVGMRLPPMLSLNGFHVVEATPRIFCVRPGDPLWSWIAAFVRSNTRRLVELGTCDPAVAEAIIAEHERASADSTSLMLTPMIIELIARKA